MPLFLGTSGATTLLGPAVPPLRRYLGLPPRPLRLLSRTHQYACLDEDLLLRLGSDGRPLSAGPAPSILRCERGDDRFVDEWGIAWHTNPHTLYFEVSEYPLQHATLDDLETFPWPELGHPARFAGLAEQARRMHDDTPYAVVAMTGVNPHEQCFQMRGLDTWLADLAGDPEFAHALLRKMVDVMLAGLRGLLQAAGPYLDMVVMGDDLGMQDRPMMSPATYRRLLKPFHAEIIAAVRRGTRAKVFFHSDGAILPLIGDLVEIGVDLLNPVQVSARGMGDTARLKRVFGRHLSFCGAVDTQQVLPFGTPAEVRSEVRRRIDDLAPGGGYVLAAVHCIQPDVPPANIVAMYEEAATYGRYPRRA